MNKKHVCMKKKKKRDYTIHNESLPRYFSNDDARIVERVLVPILKDEFRCVFSVSKWKWMPKSSRVPCKAACFRLYVHLYHQSTDLYKKLYAHLFTYDFSSCSYTIPEYFVWFDALKSCNSQWNNVECIVRHPCKHIKHKSSGRCREWIASLSVCVV